MSVLHGLRHLLCLNTGYVVTAIKDDVIWVGFHCDQCSRVTVKTVARYPAHRAVHPSEQAPADDEFSL